MVAPETLMQFMLTLRNRGITDRRVLEAMEKVPRHVFVQGHFQSRAYEDRALPIESGQTISQPTIVGMMSMALNVGSRHKVLEVGTGSGYQAAILSHLARRIYTVERHRPLARQAAKRFEQLDMANVTVIIGDGSRGLPDQAPFDRIIITAAAEDPPAILLEQLRMGGIMVLPVGQTDAVQSLVKIEKTEKGLHYTELAAVRFVPLVEGVAQEP